MGKGVTGDLQIFAGAYHGFVIRGDFVNDTAIKEKADKAMQTTVDFLNTHMKK